MVIHLNKDMNIKKVLLGEGYKWGRGLNGEGKAG
jgi:hypothetical protein